MFLTRYTSALRWRAIASSKPIRDSINRFTSTDASLSLPSLNTNFPYRWLRDSCQCPQCVHPSTLQKLHRSSDIPHDVAPKTGGVRTAAEGVHVDWKGGHSSFYPTEFLSRHASPTNLASFHHDVRRTTWKANDFVSTPHKITWDALQTDRGMLDAITQLLRYGLLFVEGVPNEETDHAKCGAHELALKFAPLKHTFYGHLWDVKNMINSRNIAYTNLYLGFHMDMQYFETPPTFQILHCIRNRVEGGTSLFADALGAAERLRAEDPAAFNVLTSTPVNFHYINDGHHVHRTHPTFQLSTFPDPITGQYAVEHINYAPPFQAPLPSDTPPALYDALAKFSELLDDEAATFKYGLREKDAVIFNNRRVLHARTSFSEGEDFMGQDGQPTANRWLIGCYFDGDSMADRRRILKAKEEKGEL
ncbi:Clavaminate synthase-like protein [Amylostereum chailletii]|nr:Clavaminate synthase-like protein [Amylostereum chailletii]